MSGYTDFQTLYPNLSRYVQQANFASPTFVRKSAKGLLHVVKKGGRNNFLARKAKLKGMVAGNVNAGKFSPTADRNLLTLNLKNIKDRRKRKLYGKVIKRMAFNL